MEANLTHHQIELSFDTLQSDLPEFHFDTDKIKQAFMNVVLNAMEAMPQGGTLTCIYFSSGSTEYVSKSLIQGLGISDEDIEHLFEPFFTRKTKGTGLGLANVKRIVEEHGGTVEIESVLGEGTTVSIWLSI